jgi:hypothetical protein
MRERSDVQIELVVPLNYSVIGSGRGHWPLLWASVSGVFYKDFPLIAWYLQRVEIKGDKIVEEMALDLSAKHVEFRSDDVQCVTIPARRADTGWGCSRPLSGSWY